MNESLVLIAHCDGCCLALKLNRGNGESKSANQEQNVPLSNVNAFKKNTQT